MVQTRMHHQVRSCQTHVRARPPDRVVLLLSIVQHITLGLAAIRTHQLLSIVSHFDSRQSTDGKRYGCDRLQHCNEKYQRTL
jgi:hypothetical protein